MFSCRRLFSTRSWKNSSTSISKNTTSPAAAMAFMAVLAPRISEASFTSPEISPRPMGSPLAAGMMSRNWKVTTSTAMNITFFVTVMYW